MKILCYFATFQLNLCEKFSVKYPSHRGKFVINFHEFVYVRKLFVYTKFNTKTMVVIFSHPCAKYCMILGYDDGIEQKPISNTYPLKYPITAILQGCFFNYFQF